MPYFKRQGRDKREFAMKVFLSTVTAALFLSGFLTAGSTDLVSTWKNPNAGPAGKAGRKLVTFLIDPDVTMREGPEETLATEIRSRGIECLAGYIVVPEELIADREKAKEFMKRMKITDALLMRVVKNEDQTTFVPGTVMYTSSAYQGFWNYWDYGWTTVYSPGYMKTDRLVSIEILLYSLDQDALLWAGRSESINPKDRRKLAKDLVDAIGKELFKAGLITRDRPE